MTTHVGSRSLKNSSLTRFPSSIGDLKAGSIVPWELQVINTLPDNFLWEKDKTSILVCSPGLYEVTIMRAPVKGVVYYSSNTSGGGGGIIEWLQ